MKHLPTPLLGGLDGSYRASCAKDSDCDREDRVDYLLEALGSFFLSAEEARGQVEDGIECDKVTAHSRGSTGPDPSKYCLV